MIELDKKELEQVKGGCWSMPSSCLITVSCYVVTKFLLSNEPITEEGLMASVFFGLILSANEMV